MLRDRIGISVLLALAAAQAPAQSPAPYEPTWDSLKHYVCPEWYRDAKFGIFIHWGVYSVPAAFSEWYPREMYQKDKPAFKYHQDHYGPQSTFGYKDFIPSFTGEKWDPEAWAALFKKSGATYVVPVGEHHDGFPMYDCSYSDWTSVKMGPHRDVVGELFAALRKQGLKCGVSSHRAFNWDYYQEHYDPEFDIARPEYAGLYGRTHGPKAPADPEFMDDWLARTQELVDKYEPDLLWFDFGFNRSEFEPYRQRLAAHYYNQAQAWGKSVVLNYKNEAFPEEAAVLDIERGKLAGIRALPWQTDTSVGVKSWGYIQNEIYKSPDALVDELIDIVSKNGCLLLNIGPKADGTIPKEAEEILLSIGRWLEVNGEGVYGTRPWKVFGEGPTRVKAGSFGESKSKVFTAEDFRFATKGDALYAFCLAWPEKELLITKLGTREGLCGDVASVEMLGSTEPLKWSQNKKGLRIKAPSTKPCEYAYGFRITLED